MPQSLKAILLVGIAALVAVAVLQPRFFGEDEVTRNLPGADAEVPATGASVANQAHAGAVGETTTEGAASVEGAASDAVTPATAAASAVEELTTRIDADPGDADAWMALGTMLVTAEDYPRASEAFAAAVEARPDDASAHAQLGRALMFQGLLRVARAELHRAIELDPTLAEAHLFLGITYSHAAPADLDAARAAWTRTMELDPTSEFAKQASGYLEAYDEPETAADTGPDGSASALPSPVPGS